MPKVSCYKRKADQLFSQVVRRSNADPNGNCKCITCGIIQHWKLMDAGHYESRKHNETRYDRRNVFPQCRTCNRFEEGRKYEFGKFLVERFGPGIIDELRVAAHKVKQFKVDELKELIKKLELELEKLK